MIYLDLFTLITELQMYMYHKCKIWQLQWDFRFLLIISISNLSAGDFPRDFVFQSIQNIDVAMFGG